MDIISSINSSIQIVKRLKEVSKNVEAAEFNNLLADLSNELADNKIQIADLKREISKKDEEIERLKARFKAQDEKKSVKWGCYQFEGDNGLYCTACYDSKGEKILTTRLNSSYRKCPICKSLFGS